jgi:hypothetical protein
MNFDPLDHSHAYTKAELRARQIDAIDRMAARRLADANSPEAIEARQLKLEAKRAMRYRRLTIMVLIAAPCAIGYGMWAFVVEPMVHYHSLSVACSANVRAACNALTNY